MNPICGQCNTEMHRQGATVTLGYCHNHAPVDYSRAAKYVCAGCNDSVYLPIGYAFEMATGEVKDFLPVQPLGSSRSSGGKLP